MSVCAHFRVLLSFITISIVLCDQYASVPNCPGVQNPVIITDGVLNKNVFYAIQSHDRTQGLYRRRFSFHRASEGIGTDPKIDFKNKKTAVFLDGYLDSTNFPPARIALGQFAELGYNAISVDAQRLFSFVFPVAARIGYQVGNFTAIILNDLLKYGLRPEDIELFGISLGGQTVSFVGKYFTKYSGRKVGKIYSMDPGGPCYRGLGPSGHLTPTDADFVQVIHTASEGYGMGEAQGHVDFYLNGGEVQFFVDPSQPWCEDFCGHALSFVYLFVSLRFHPDEFVGVRCEGVQQAREHRCYDNFPVVRNVLGAKADPSKPGIFYVPVGAVAPFFAPKNFVEKRINYPLIYNDALSEVEHFLLDL